MYLPEKGIRRRWHRPQPGHGFLWEHVKASVSCNRGFSLHAAAVLLRGQFPKFFVSDVRSRSAYIANPIVNPDYVDPKASNGTTIIAHQDDPHADANQR